MFLCMGRNLKENVKHLSFEVSVSYLFGDINLLCFCSSYYSLLPVSMHSDTSVNVAITHDSQVHFGPCPEPKSCPVSYYDDYRYLC